MEYHLNNSDSEDELLNESRTSWGGSWTEQKLDAFEKYVNAYLTIMNRHRDKYHWTMVYFDGFAGSGSRINQEDQSELLHNLFKDDAFDEEEINVYKGAAERVLSIEQRGFDYYYFVDKDKEANDALKEKLKKYEKTHQLQFRPHDANVEIVNMANALHVKKINAALVLLDPFGMQIDWSSLEKLKDTHTDLWILIPSGVIINRLLDRKGELTHIEKLSSFFGMSGTEIKKFFYEEKQEMNLFGEEDTIVQKVNEPIKKIAELYISKLKTLFKEVTEKPLVMRNSKNTPIYHFAFASNNKAATKIAKQIIKKVQ